MKKLAGLLLAMLASALGAQQPAAFEARATALVRDFDLVEAVAPVREDPRWVKPRRIVVRADFPGLIEKLRPFAPGVELVAAGSEAEAAAAARDADAVIGYCTREIIRAGTELRWIQLFTAGSDECLGALEPGRPPPLVTNMQRLSGPEIAEHALALLLAFTRGLDAYIPAQRTGTWNDGLVPRARTWELGGRTLLVVGLGGIGTDVARRANALGMRVVATRASGRSKPAFVDVVGGPEDLPRLAGEADAVVNAVPLTPQTTGLFDKAFFAALKPGAYFINVGRGQTVVTGDLVEALRSGRLGGAGLDVVDPEPLPPDHPLWRMPNVIITPHVAFSSDKVFQRRVLLAQENLRRYVAGERMLSVVDPARGY